MLYSQSLGQGPDLVILHGLFGSSDNFLSFAKAIASHYRVHLVDLPNHGRSAWTERFTLSSAANAVCEWMKTNDLTHVSVLGHSLGGKVAMECVNGEHSIQFEQLIVVDIAPKAYPPQHNDILEALKKVNLSHASSRKEIEVQMKTYIASFDIRQFLMKSLEKEHKGFRWRFNSQVLSDDYSEISKQPSWKQPNRIDALFVKGELSDYILSSDYDIILSRFPNAKIHTISNAGHWPHAEARAVFESIVSDFLSQCP